MMVVCTRPRSPSHIRVPGIVAEASKQDPVELAPCAVILKLSTRSRVESAGVDEALVASLGAAGFAPRHVCEFLVSSDVAIQGSGYLQHVIEQLRQDEQQCTFLVAGSDDRRPMGGTMSSLVELVHIVVTSADETDNVAGPPVSAGIAGRLWSDLVREFSTPPLTVIQSEDLRDDWVAERVADAVKEAYTLTSNPA